MVTPEIEMSQVSSVFLRLKEFPKHMDKASMSALVRAKNAAITEMARIIPKIYDISKEDIKLKATMNTKIDVSTASISVKGTFLTVARFPHTPTEPPSEKPSYIPTISIKKKKKDLKKKKISNGEERSVFIAKTGTLRSNGIPYIFFYRNGKGEKKEKISALYTLSIPQMISNPDVNEKISEKFETTFIKRIEHEANRQLDNIAIDGFKLASK